MTIGESGLLILLVEDNPGDAGLLEEALAEFDRPVVIERVERIEQAERRLREGVPADVIVLDLGLPDSSGLDTLERINTAASHIPIIVLTGQDDESLGLEALRRGAQDYQVKGQIRPRALVRAIHHATERKRLERTLRRTVDRLELLAEVTAELLASDKPQQVVETLCRKVMAHLDCDVFFNFLVDAHEDRLHLNACAGIPPEVVGTVEWLDIGAAVCGCAARERCRIVAEDISHTTDPRADLVRSFGVQAYACHPLMNQGQVIGTLSFGARNRPRFSEEELALMKAVSDQVAIAMQRVRFVETLEDRVAQRTAEAERRTAQLRFMAAELSQTEQRERRRLSQVLHDHLQQILVAARMKVGRLRHRAGQDQGLVEIADQVEELIDQSIAESRALTVELSPPVLYDGGLAAGLDWLGRRMEEKHGLQVEIHADRLDEPADQGLRVFLFQATRELLLNVVKHARAPRACVGMSRTEEGELRIEVRDDGAGCEVSRMTNPSGMSGFGLFSLQERLELLGGRMQVQSALGAGTRVEIFVPPDVRPSVPNSIDSGGSGPQQAELAVGQPAVTNGKLHVLLADDHPVVRKGLADLLREQPGVTVVLEARDGQEAIDLAIKHRPEVVVMDITMPGLSGIEATRQIKAALPESRVIGLSMHEDPKMAQAMCEAGASAYLRKDSSSDDLIAMIAAEAPCDQ